MTVLADTDVLIDHLRGIEQATRVLEPLISGGEEVTGSTITRAELLAGRREGRDAALPGLLDAIEWLPVTDEVAELAAELWRRHRRSSPRVVLADYLIAATAQLLGARLLTRNVRLFPMFPGLRAPYEL